MFGGGRRTTALIFGPALLLTICFRRITQDLPQSGLSVPTFHRSARMSVESAPPFPIAFGPASAPAALAIRRALRTIGESDAALDRAFAGEAAEYASASETFVAAVNAHSATPAAVEALVVAWLRATTTRDAAGDFVRSTLKQGIPVIGQRSGSRVVCARAAQKWLKAGKKLRKGFATVEEYGFIMDVILFQYIPRAMEVMGGGASPFAAAKAAEKGKLKTADGPVVILYSRDTGEFTVVPESEKESAIAEKGLVNLRDHIDLLRYAAFYLCRETSPPTILPDYTSALTGWQYNGDEEDMLTALHFPIYDEELTQLVAESDGGSANEMHHAQIDILQQYFKDHKASNVRFHEKKWSKAAVGGAGRASAEVTRDLSNFYPSITAIAVDHRQDIADVFEKDGSAKKAFANFIKELGKKWHHLPSFANDAVAAHYLALYDELNKRGKDAWTAENIGRILRANAKILGDKALPSDGSESKLTAASNFVIDFGARGSGDVLFAAPKCYNGENPYVPGTMDEKLLEQATALLAGKV